MPKPAELGDLQHITKRLRQLMHAYDNAAFALDGRLIEIDLTAESLAVGLRLQLRRSANDVYKLLERLEGLPNYMQLRKDILTSNE